MDVEPPATLEEATVGEEYLFDTVPRSEDELQLARSMARWRDPRRARQKPPPPIIEDVPALERPS